MRDYNPKEPLISLHLPKCAGTSFNNVLKEWFFPLFWRHYYNQKTGKNPIKLPLSQTISKFNKLCIHGHFDNRKKIGVKDYYPNAKQFVSIMRDPIETRLSMYNYMKYSAKKGAFYSGGNKVRSFDTPIDDFFTNGRLVMLDLMPFDFTVSNYKDVINNNFIYFGLFENIQESVNDLADILSTKSINIPHLNKAEKEYYPSQEALNTFKDNHVLEYKIYDYLKVNS